jgi:hypothetical protein
MSERADQVAPDFDPDRATMSAVFHPAVNTEDQASVTMGSYEVYLWFAEDGTLSLNVIKPRGQDASGRWGAPLPVDGKVDLFIDNDFTFGYPADPSQA